MIERNDKHMKKKHGIVLWIIMVCLLSLAGSAAIVAFILKAQTANVEKETVINVEYFSSRTDVEAFQSVPVITGKNIKIGEVADYGDDYYLVGINGTTTEEYLAYLDTLIADGFMKHSDNGVDAMDGYAMTAAFTKGETIVVVSQALKQDKTYISAAIKKNLSDYMIYSEDWKQGISPDAVTKVHMMEVNANGACFIIQLKNGNFIIHDGGKAADAPYLLDYLESLTPEGKKPVVEAWFISHCHGDHYGALNAISKNPQYLNRLYVNGIYYHAPSDEIVALSYDSSPESAVFTCSRLYVMFKAEDGSQTKYYRPQFGQRYYFCDITIDVSMTPEQYTQDALYMTGASTDMNDTSIWLMHKIEEQTLLIGGDAFHTGVRAMMNMYEPEYLSTDLFAVLHHGINVYNYFTDYTTWKTVLYPNFRVGSIWEGIRTDLSRTEDNKHLVEVAAETISCENGTVVLGFPYKIGQAKIMEPCDWRYHAGVRQIGDFNIAE